MFTLKSSKHKTKAVVIGSGAFGTALAKVFTDSHLSIKMWSHSKDTMAMINQHHENLKYLPDVVLSKAIYCTNNFWTALEDVQIVFFSVPTQVTREVLLQAKPYLKANMSLVICSKGIERGSNQLISDIFIDILGESWRNKIFVLSGPSFAYEIARQIPTALTLAGTDAAKLSELQKQISNPYFRLYTSADIIGVQLAGALKNVVAIACGVSDGMKLGHSTRAALMSRGLSEMVRLGKCMGADPVTFLGLSGIGDLSLTCSGNLSRNRRVGINLGKGMKMKDIMNSLQEVAEGVYTVESAYALTKKYKLDLPIIEQTYKLIYKNQSAKTVLKTLMNRDLKSENDI